MPELPEVEICRRGLMRQGAGRVVRAVVVPDPGAIRGRRDTRPSRALPDGEAQLRARVVGKRAGALSRHGKRIAWAFPDGGLLLTLGMTGKWAPRPMGDEPRFGRLALVLDDRALWFIDTRRFGCVVPAGEARLDELLHEGLGPDALLDPPTASELAARMRTVTPIKVALMDQARLAGVGNIHAAEVCWRARIHPATPALELDAAAWERLAQAIPAWLAHMVELQDTDEMAYINEGGDNPFEVYGRVGAPCRRCGDAVQSARHGGRITVWCATCQPAVGAP